MKWNMVKQLEYMRCLRSCANGLVGTWYWIPLSRNLIDSWLLRHWHFHMFDSAKIIEQEEILCTTYNHLRFEIIPTVDICSLWRKICKSWWSLAAVELVSFKWLALICYSYTTCSYLFLFFVFLLYRGCELTHSHVPNQSNSSGEMTILAYTEFPYKVTNDNHNMHG